MIDIQNKTESVKEQADEALQRFADGFSWLRRSPVLHWPSEHGLDYEDITFPAHDGVPLEGWFIPAPGSGKLIIANHPMGFSRSGIPADVQPWHADWAPSGNGFEVDLVPDYKILHDAGHNVLAYDLRNHGLSSAANGGVTTHGNTESRDVVGSLEYARTRPDTRDMEIGLFSRCMGGVSTLAAMTRFPARSKVCAAWCRRNRSRPGTSSSAGWPCLASAIALTTSTPSSGCVPATGSTSESRKSGPRTSACRRSSTRFASIASPTQVTSRRCTTTSQ